jgi:hypothetical protein
MASAAGSVSPQSAVVRPLGWKRPLPIALLAVALVLSLAVYLVSRPGHLDLNPASLHARASLSIETYTGAQAALSAWGVPDGALNVPLPLHKGEKYIVGHLTYTPPTGIMGQLVVFLIDRRTGKPLTMWGVLPNPRYNGGSGWDGRYNAFPERYPWLSGLASIHLPNGSYTDPADTFSVGTEAHGPLTFVAPLSPWIASQSTSPAPFSVVIGVVDDHDRVWAERVPVASS